MVVGCPASNQTAAVILLMRGEREKDMAVPLDQASYQKLRSRRIELSVQVIMPRKAIKRSPHNTFTPLISLSRFTDFTLPRHVVARLIPLKASTSEQELT